LDCYEAVIVGGDATGSMAPKKGAENGIQVLLLEAS